MLTPTAVFDRIVQRLRQAGVPFTLHEHAPLRTVQDVEEQLPVVAGRMLKTIAFRQRNGRWLLAGLRGAERIDYRLLAQAVGRSRRDIASMAPAEVERQLGFAVGGVGPFALQPDVTVLLDAALPQLPVVFCGSGRNDVTLEIGFADLHRVTGARICPLARREPSATG